MVRQSHPSSIYGPDPMAETVVPHFHN